MATTRSPPVTNSPDELLADDELDEVLDEDELALAPLELLPELEEAPPPQPTNSTL